MLCGQLIHGKGAKNTHGEKIVSSVNIVGNWTSLSQTIDKINLKWVNDLNIRPEKYKTPTRKHRQ